MVHLEKTSRLVARARASARVRSRGVRALGQLGVLDLGLLLLQARLRRCLLIVGYHRVAEAEEIGDLDPGVRSCTPAEFAAQLRLLRRYLKPTSFGELLELEAALGGVPGRQALVTFDDGYADNYRHAFPLLREAGLSATIFLATGYLDEPRLYWWDLLALALRRRPERVAEALARHLPHALRNGSAVVTLSQHLALLKSVPDGLRRAFVAELERLYETELEPVPRQTLTWKQVREMAREGIQFGGHTVSHPVLSRLPEARLEAEVAGCRRRIAEETGQEAVAFAYPVGGAAAFTPAVVRAVREAGYRYGVSYISGWNHVARLDRYALRRVRADYPPGGAASGLKADLLRPALSR